MLEGVLYINCCMKGDMQDEMHKDIMKIATAKYYPLAPLPLVLALSLSLALTLSSAFTSTSAFAFVFALVTAPTTVAAKSRLSKVLSWIIGLIYRDCEPYSGKDWVFYKNSVFSQNTFYGNLFYSK